MPANKTRSPAISPAPRNLESAVRREHRGVLQWPRSTGPAIFAGKAYVDQLWFFWLAPVSGAVVAGLVGGALFRKPE